MIPLLEKFIDLLVSWFRGFLLVDAQLLFVGVCFVGFLFLSFKVSWFIGFKVSWSQKSKFQRFSDPILCT